MGKQSSTRPPGWLHYSVDNLFQSAYSRHMAEWPQRRSFGDIGNRLEYATTDATRMRHLHSKAIDQVEHLLESERRAGVSTVDYSYADNVELRHMDIDHVGPIASEQFFAVTPDTLRLVPVHPVEIATRAVVQLTRNRRGPLKEKVTVSVRQSIDGTVGMFVNDYTIESFVGGGYQGTVAHTMPGKKVGLMERSMTPYDFHQLDLQLGELAIMAGAPLALLSDGEEKR